MNIHNKNDGKKGNIWNNNHSYKIRRRYSKFLQLAGECRPISHNFLSQVRSNEKNMEIRHPSYKFNCILNFLEEDQVSAVRPILQAFGDHF